MAEQGQVKTDDELDAHAEATRRLALAQIRQYPDPVLRLEATEIVEFDGDLEQLVARMIHLMQDARGVGLAANQVGVQKRIFVYDAGDGPFTVVNPTIAETSERWEYEEGCLSVPGLYFPIVRPRCVTLSGYDLNGKEFVREGQDLLGRIFLHETDHLDGYLLLDRLEAGLRREAMKILRSGGTGGQVRRLGAKEDAGGPPPRPE